MHKLLSTLAVAAVSVQMATALAGQTPQPGKSGRSATAQKAGAAGPLEKAEALLQEQKFAEAEEKLNAIVAKENKNPQAWFDLGFAQSHLGKTQDAIASYRKATELSPKWFEAQQNLGLSLAKANDFPAAAAALKIAVTLKPSAGGQKALSQAWTALAQVSEETNPQEALAAYQRAAELGDSAAQLGVARMAERSGNTALAEQQYLKLAEAGNTDAIEGLVHLYLQQKRYGDAETWLRKYTANNPKNAMAQAQLGKLLAAQGKTQEAIAALEPVYDINHDPMIAHDLAGLYLDAKQYDAAAKLLEQLVPQSQNDPQLHFDYGSALLHQHKYPEAQAELTKAVQLKPGLVEAYFDLAYAAQQNKNYELVIRVLDARAKVQPDTPATYFLRAEAFDSLRMYKPAADNYKLFLAAANGKYPDQEFQARHRLKAIQPQ